MTDKILMIVGDFSEDYEVMVPYQTLETTGFDVDTVCPGKEEGEKIKTAIHDFRGDQTYMETRGHDFALTATFEEIDPGEYDGLVLPGGRAPEYLRSNETVLNYVRAFFEEDKPVAAICHGPQILTAAGVLDGHQMTSYPDLASDIEAGGGSWVEDNVVSDGNLVTAQAWPDHPDWLAEFLSLFGSEQVAIAQQAD